MKMLECGTRAFWAIQIGNLTTFYGMLQSKEENTDLGSYPGFVISWLCDLGQITKHLWVSVSSFVD